MLLQLVPRAVSIQPPPDRRVLRTFAALGLFWSALWLISVVGLWSAQSLLVFRAPASRSFTGPFDAGVFVEHSFTNADGLTLDSVLLAHDPPDDRYWILFCPPAGASIRVLRFQGQLRDLWSLGYNVMAFDYRGFGRSSGTPSERGLYADAAAAYGFLLQEKTVNASRVILAGRSLGASIALELATRVHSAGVLLFSPIDSVPAVATRLFPWVPVRLLTRYQFDNTSKARTIHQAVTLVYSAPDEFMPLFRARALFDEFRGPKQMLETSGAHLDSGFTNLGELRRTLVAFWPPDIDREPRRGGW